MASLFVLTLSPWLIGSTWSAFYAYQGLGNDASMEFVADVYRHTFAMFTGTVELSLPVFELDPTVLWKGAWYDFIDMWNFARFAPEELVKILKKD